MKLNGIQEVVGSIRPAPPSNIMGLATISLTPFSLYCYSLPSSPHFGKFPLVINLTANTRITLVIHASRLGCSPWFALKLLSIPWCDRLPQVEQSPSEMTQGPGPFTAHLTPTVSR